MPALQWDFVYDRWFACVVSIDDVQHTIVLNGFDQEMAHNRFYALFQEQVVLQNSSEIPREAAKILTEQATGKKIGF